MINVRKIPAFRVLRLIILLSAANIDLMWNKAILVQTWLSTASHGGATTPFAWWLLCSAWLNLTPILPLQTRVRRRCLHRFNLHVIGSPFYPFVRTLILCHQVYSRSRFQWRRPQAPALPWPALKSIGRDGQISTSHYWLMHRGSRRTPETFRSLVYLPVCKCAPGRKLTWLLSFHDHRCYVK